MKMLLIPSLLPNSQVNLSFLSWYWVFQLLFCFYFSLHTPNLCLPPKTMNWARYIYIEYNSLTKSKSNCGDTSLFKSCVFHVEGTKISFNVRHFHSNPSAAMQVLEKYYYFHSFLFCLEITVPNWNAITAKISSVYILCLFFFSFPLQ